MKKYLKQFLFLVIFFSGFLVWGNASAATTYYVQSTCEAGITTYNPTTYSCTGGSATVFSTIMGAINALNLEGDDILEVRADSDNGSKTFYEKVTLGADDVGTDGHNIIIRAAAGDSITIDGNDTYDHGFYISAVSYITIDGFTITGQTGVYNTYVNGIMVRGSNATNKVSGITIQNCNINIQNESGTVTTRRGITILYADNIDIYNNTVTTDNYIEKQTDGIYLQASSNIDVFNNTVVITNLYSDGHNDCVQVAGGNGSTIPYDSTSNITIRGNTLVQDNEATTYRQLVYVEYEVQGYIKIYNNVLYSTNAMSSNMLSVYNNGVGGTRGTAYIYNNSLYSNGAANAIVTDSGVDNSYIKNNLIYINVGSGASACIYCASATQTPSQIDYNQCYKIGGTDNYRIAGTFYTFANWQAAGYDNHGHWGDPLYVDLVEYPYDLSPMASSYAINHGVDLSGDFTSDILGNERSGTWDIGAYEYVGAADVVAPASPTGLAVS